MRLPANREPVSPTVFLTITALVFGISAVSAYASLMLAPLFPRTAPALRATFWGVNLLLYLMAPFCWQMPLSWRKAHLVMWLSFNLIARILASQIPTGARHSALVDGILFILGLIVDAMFLTSGILAIRVRQKDEKLVEKWYLILLAILPAAGVYLSLAIWSKQISDIVFIKAEKIAQGRPYCIASKWQKVQSLSQLSGVSLLRSRFYTGPGAGFSFPTLSRFYAVLAVQTEHGVRYWNWSFKRREFVLDADTPQELLRSEVCERAGLDWIQSGQ